jgi:hypothetical protein
MANKQLMLICATSLLLSGCAVGFMTSHTFDPKTGESTKTVYSPLFSSESMSLAGGAEFRVSVVITRRVEPISYILLSSVGGLTSDDMESKATAVVHFKNDSQQIYKIKLIKFIIWHRDFPINVPDVILEPGDRFDTKSVAVKAPTYDKDFSLDLLYELDGQSFSRMFSLRRETMEKLRE